MPLQRRLPKIGFVSPSKGLSAELRVHELASFAGKTADLASLQAAGLVSKRAERCKVIASGKLDKAVTVGGADQGDARRAQDHRSGRRQGNGVGLKADGEDAAQPIRQRLLGDATRFADLRQRLFFLLGALVVYRIGTLHPGAGHRPGRARSSSSSSSPARS